MKKKPYKETAFYYRRMWSAMVYEYPDRKLYSQKFKYILCRSFVETNLTPEQIMKSADRLNGVL